MRIIGVNGLFEGRTSNNKTTDILLRYLNNKHGAKVIDFNHPFRTPLSQYFPSIVEDDAKALIDISEPGDMILSHSAGAHIVHTALMLGAKFSTIFLLASALDEKIAWVGQYDKIYNVYNPTDKTLELSDLLPYTRYGTLGKYGYEGPKNDKLLEIDANKVHIDKARFWTHKDYFKPLNLPIWASLIMNEYTAEPNE